MKQRFSTLDVRTIASELAHTLPGTRISNIYDLSSRIFLFKFVDTANPSATTTNTATAATNDTIPSTDPTPPKLPASGGSTKYQLLVDSGFRCHLTDYSRTTAGAPSVFVSKLRKVLKGRRVLSVRQVGWDRVIEIVVSGGGGGNTVATAPANGVTGGEVKEGAEGSIEKSQAKARQRHVFLEFFAGGNIVVTDGDLNVVGLLREVREGDEEVDIKIGGKYRVDVKQGYGEEEHSGDGKRVDKEEVRTVLERHVEKMKAQAGNPAVKKKKKDADDLKKVIANQFAQYSSHLLEHVFKIRQFDATVKPEAVLNDSDTFDKLMECVAAADEIFKTLGATSDAKGYIIAKLKDEQTPSAVDDAKDKRAPARENLLYDDFHPFRPSQFEDRPDIHILELAGFNKTVDEFYSSLESQKLTSRLTEREETAKRKLETAKAEHEKRLGALQKVQELHIRKAQAIEANTHQVEEACAAVNGLIAQGMDWMDIGKLIENEQAKKNPLAMTVKLPLKLYENTVTLVLDEAHAGDEDSDEELQSEDEDGNDDEYEETHKPSHPDNTPQALTIDIDLALSPWANARQYYDQKRTAADKEQRTVQASARALASTEKKIAADLKKGLKQETQTLRPTRQQFFFEKFLYFISSDGYLVIGGKDLQQSELLYRRYLKRGDVYVHADLHGATSVIVKNDPSNPDAPIPPSTLSQAGALVVCTSSAWESKAVMAAWWVNAEQVSKTVEGTGQYLGKDGDFYVRGQKNFLPPSQLLLGFAVAWLVGEEDAKVYGKKRGREVVGSGQDGRAQDFAGEMEALSVNHTVEERSAADGERGEVMNDVEDAADDLAEDVDVEEETTHGADHDDSEGDREHVSVTADTDDEADHRQNPLQVNGAAHQDHDSDADGTHSEDDQDTDANTGVEGETDKQQSDDDHNLDDPVIMTTEANGDEAHQDPSPSSTQPTLKPNTKPPSKPHHPTRGKQSKTSRLKARRYAAQDDSDRDLAMTLLGHATPSQQTAKQAADLAAQQEKEAQLQREREKKTARQERGKKLEEERRKKLEEQDRSAGANAGDNTTAGSTITTAIEDESTAQEITTALACLLPSLPSPSSSDTHSITPIAAIPILAPWSSLTTYKYKVKLSPGSQKKGKALREILDSWITLGTKGGKGVIDAESRDTGRMWPGEIERLREWRVEEVVGVVPVKGVRIVRGGGLGGGMGGAGGGGGAKGGGGKAARGGRASKKGR